MPLWLGAQGEEEEALAAPSWALEALCWLRLAPALALLEALAQAALPLALPSPLGWAGLQVVGAVQAQAQAQAQAPLALQRPPP